MVIVSACWNKPVTNSIVGMYFQRLEFRQYDIGLLQGLTPKLKLASKSRYFLEGYLIRTAEIFQINNEYR